MAESTRETSAEAGVLPPESGLAEKITRFDVHQIIQHAGLMMSFVLLVVTGLPLKFHDWSISQSWVGLWGGVEVTRSVHHVSAWVMVLVCVYHILYVFRRPFSSSMFPSIQDLVDIFREMIYFTGLRDEKPKYDRYNWREKFDYWAILWGMPVMGISGFILMYPTLAAKFLPGWAFPVALVAHSDEAMLALVWIFMVHVFFNHLTPSAFPINTSIFTGKVPRERYREEHPLEYERLVASSNKNGQS